MTLATGLAEYGPLVILILIAISFGMVNLIATTLLGPGRTGKTKEGIYGTGMTPFHSSRHRFNVRFYVLAMTFLVFDVEIVFLYPWSTVFANLEPGDPLGLQFLMRMFFFVATSIIAFVYAWRKGVFQFD